MATCVLNEGAFTCHVTVYLVPDPVKNTWAEIWTGL